MITTTSYSAAAPARAAALAPVRRWGAVVLAVMAVLGGGVVGAGPAAAASPAPAPSPARAAVTQQTSTAPVRDGSAPALAAPSCWAIKQTRPSSRDGVYWLQTAALVAPEQFYCDQSTAGGGWVLVGRGRDGWSWSGNGQGSPATLRTTVSGPDAFAPATLPASTVDALLDGAALDALPDGIRVRRATDEAGSRWQEMRLRPTRRAGWTWAFGGGVRLSSVVVDGTDLGAGNTQLWARQNNQGLLRLNTQDLAAHGYRRGFGYGTQIGGSNNATSHLWELSTENQALPFTQVFLRPRSTASTFPALPDTGIPAQPQRALAANRTSTATPWGVTGVVGGGFGELNMEVEDIAFLGRTAYVGGKFEYVQRGPNPAAGEKIRQPYLAAFDVDTGEWRPDFRPALDGMVWSLATTPDGRLIVGGEFTSASGAAGTSSLVALNPTTGAPDPYWQAPVTHVGDNTPNVRSLDVQDGWIYVGGRFNRIAGGARPEPLVLSGVARVAVADGGPDPQWKPHVDGTVFELDASARGDRVYLAGRFDNVNFEASPMHGVVSTDIGAPRVTGLASWVPASGSGTNTYQQTVLEVDDQVWLGGSQHILGAYGRDRYDHRASAITRNGGDFQALAVVNGVVYGACHCIHYTYSGTTDYGSPVNSAADVDSIAFIGAWDAATGAYLPEFQPTGLNGRNDMGPWALRAGPDGCLWFGGDFVRGSWQGSGYQWLGGFGKLCARDTTPPPPPSGLVATPTVDGGTTVRWDAGGSEAGTDYEVLRDDRVVAVTGARTVTDPTAVLPARYAVRAIDASGNRSASTPVVTVLPPDTTAPTAVTGLTGHGGPDRVDLSWTAATDDRGVTGYRIVRDGLALPGPATTTTYTDPGLRPLRTYRYTVTALDAAGNLGPPSAPLDVMTGADGTVLVDDGWPGPDAESWPVVWTTLTGGGGTVRTAGGTGQLATVDSAGASARGMLTGAPAVRDGEALLSYRWTSTDPGGFLSLHLRGSGGWANTYRPREGLGLQLTPSSGTVTVQRVAGGAVSTLATVPGAQSVGTGRQWLRLRVVDDRIAFRVWDDGQAEPIGWDGEVRDNGVTAAGQMFVALNRGGSGTGSKAVELDDLLVRDVVSG